MSVTTVPIQPIQKGLLTKIWIGVLLIAGAALLLAYTGTQSVVIDGANNEQFLAANADEDGVVTTESGLQYKVIKPGEGPSPTATDTALVKYEGRLRDNTIFSEALQLMQKGGEYRIWTPSELAYGESSPGDQIPPNSLLIFDVTLLDYISAAQMEELRQQMQAQGGMLGGTPPQGMGQ